MGGLLARSSFAGRPPAPLMLLPFAVTLFLKIEAGAEGLVGVMPRRGGCTIRAPWN